MLVTSTSAVEPAKEIAAKHPVICLGSQRGRWASSADLVVTGECDPWHMLQNASALVGEPGDELRMIAGLLEVPCFGGDGANGKLVGADVDPARLIADQFAETAFENPFTGEPMAPLEAVALCSFWRDLIDSNRDIAGGARLRFLEAGSCGAASVERIEPFEFVRSTARVGKGASVAIWRSKVSSEMIVELRAGRRRLDRSRGRFPPLSWLGADCVPPLVDHGRPAGRLFRSEPSPANSSFVAGGDFDAELLATRRESCAI